MLGFEPKRIAGFPSEVLVLGAYSAEHGVVLVRPDRDVDRARRSGEWSGADRQRASS